MSTAHLAPPEASLKGIRYKAVTPFRDPAVSNIQPKSLKFGALTARTSKSELWIRGNRVFKKLAGRLSSRFGSVQKNEEQTGPTTPAPGSTPEELAQPVIGESDRPESPGVLPPDETLASELAKLRATLPNGSDDPLALLDRLGGEDEHLVRQPPMAAQKVLAVCRRDTSSLEDLTALVERDPALTQDLLQHANSAFYASGSDTVTSLHASVQRVGMAGVEAVMMKRLVEGMLSRPGEPHDRMVGKVWPHLVRTAPLARRLAAAFSVEPERAFTLALLHDVGKLVFFDHIAALRTALRRPPQLPSALVSESLRILHEPLGGMAAKRWGLDDDSVNAIANHHRRTIHSGTSAVGEVIYLAERTDITRQKSQRIELESWWQEGRLTGSLEQAQKILAAVEDT